MSVQRLAVGARSSQPDLAANGCRAQRNRRLTQDGEAGEIRLYGFVVTGMPRIPAARGLEEGCAHDDSLALARRSVNSAHGAETPGRRRADITVLLQTPQGARGHPIRAQLTDALLNPWPQALVIQSLRIAIRPRRTDPFRAPRGERSGAAAQPGIG